MDSPDWQNGLAHTEIWPPLPFEEWKDTYATLHMWTQIVGKIRLVQTPWVNHSWHVALYVTPRGMTTTPIPHGTRTFQIDFDFIDHQLVIQTSDGAMRTMTLRPVSVADFYAELMTMLRDLELSVSIVTKPNEVELSLPFERDHTHASYNPSYANRFWRVLLQSDRVLKEFRARFIGKCSPVHFSGVASILLSHASQVARHRSIQVECRICPIP